MTPAIADPLSPIKGSTAFLLPELALFAGIVILILLSLRKNSPSWLFYLVVLVAFIANILLILGEWPTSPVSIFNSMIRVDDFSASFKLLVGFGGSLTLAMTNPRSFKMESGLLLSAVLVGANFLLMSTHLVMVVLSLELISISSYLLTAGTEPDKRRAEAAWKFFLFGSAATAMMIFGMSYLFGLSGTLNFSSSDFFETLIDNASPILLLGGLFTFAGFLFKMTSIPFHLWAPDVYEVTPTPVVAFFSVVPKLAGLGIMIKFSLALHTFGQSGIDWSMVIGSVALISILLGSLAALAQQNAKRMMAWSSVAQAGFLLIAISGFSIEGVRTVIFYAAIFTVMNFLTFMMIDLGEKNLNSSEMKSFAGWGYKATAPSLYLLAGLISLVGLPPTAGFMAKLFVFSSVWEKYQETGNMAFGVFFAIGLLSTVLSLFFYLRIPYYLFIKSGESSSYSIKISPFNNLLALILVTLLLLLFFYPALLMGWTNKVNFVL